jgi:hypothetical protein
LPYPYTAYDSLLASPPAIAAGAAAVAAEDVDAAEPAGSAKGWVGVFPPARRQGAALTAATATGAVALPLWSLSLCFADKQRAAAVGDALARARFSVRVDAINALRGVLATLDDAL